MLVSLKLYIIVHVAQMKQGISFLKKTKHLSTTARSHFIHIVMPYVMLHARLPPSSSLHLQSKVVSTVAVKMKQRLTEKKNFKAQQQARSSRYGTVLCDDDSSSDEDSDDYTDVRIVDNLDTLFDSSPIPRQHKSSALFIDNFRHKNKMPDWFC